MAQRRSLAWTELRVGILVITSFLLLALAISLHAAVKQRKGMGDGFGGFPFIQAAALNFGLRQTDADVVVAIDADTIFETDTVARLTAHFADPRIGAVAGNAKVGNRVNLLTRWQALEYITSQNLDRRAFDFLNCITVVPGAVGAWRRQLVIDAGHIALDLTFRHLHHTPDPD
jgi:hypothetical protein